MSVAVTSIESKDIKYFKRSKLPVLHAQCNKVP